MSNVKRVLALSLFAVGLAGCGTQLGTARNVEVMGSDFNKAMYA